VVCRSLFSFSSIFGFILALSGCGGGGSAASSGSISGTNVFTVTTPNAPSSYNINGSENPGITVQRGQTYTFALSTSGHPFYIMSVQGSNTANAYTNGVTGNGNQSGSLTFIVPVGAPNTLYYDCSIHGAMTGVITVTN
jgi:hypothetical protein